VLQCAQSTKAATSPTSPEEITETTLAHVIGDKAERAYRRGDALEKRRKLMEAWASYCEPKGLGNVIQIGADKAKERPTSAYA